MRLAMLADGGDARADGRQQAEVRPGPLPGIARGRQRAGEFDVEDQVGNVGTREDELRRRLVIIPARIAVELKTLVQAVLLFLQQAEARVGMVPQSSCAFLSGQSTLWACRSS
nr:hypothetical protein [Chitinimonas koreensis]